MLQYDNFSAWITVDDKPLEEYDVQVEEGANTVTCWIASDSAKLADLERQMEALRKQINKGCPRKKVEREPIVGVTIDLTKD
ncbi:hypothetical protein PQX77_018210 [Marasmius sp. AFHP31]|nr:hypothetical protein PQX77_018210 [Marasmius sp. AFHP31]